jgi:hypothetical protein
MNDTGPIRATGLGNLGEPIQQSMHQGAGLSTRTRVNDEAGGLVQDQDVVVEMEYRQLSWLGLEIVSCGSRWRIPSDSITRLEEP